MAAVLYFFIVAPMNRIKERKQRGIKSESGPDLVPDDIALLTEIRDLLKSQS